MFLLKSRRCFRCSSAEFFKMLSMVNALAGFMSWMGDPADSRGVTIPTHYSCSAVWQQVGILVVVVVVRVVTQGWVTLSVVVISGRLLLHGSPLQRSSSAPTERTVREDVLGVRVDDPVVVLAPGT